MGDWRVSTGACSHRRALLLGNVALVYTSRWNGVSNDWRDTRSFRHALVIRRWFRPVWSGERRG
jgi:hypothetical protein